jgi:hypothetical protein
MDPSAEGDGNVDGERLCGEWSTSIRRKLWAYPELRSGYGVGDIKYRGNMIVAYRLNCREFESRIVFIYWFVATACLHLRIS